MLRDSYHIGGNSMIKLYEEFNDLYKLHRAAVELSSMAFIVEVGDCLSHQSLYIPSLHSIASTQLIGGNLKYKKS